MGLPGGPVVKNVPTNAGDTGSIPGLGRFHMPWAAKAVHQLLSPCSTIQKPHGEKPMQDNQE